MNEANQQSISAELSFGSYLKSSFNTTTKHYIPLLGYALFIALYYAAVASSYHFLDTSEDPRMLSVIMMAWLLIMPLINGYLYFHEQTLVEKHPSFGASFIIGFQKLLVVVATFIGILLLPGLALGIGLSAIFFAIQKSLTIVVVLVSVVTIVLMVLLCNTRLLSLMIVLFSPTDSNSALVQNKALVAPAFIATIFRSTLAFFLILGLFFAPIWLDFLVPETFNNEIISIAATSVIIALVMPFLWSMIIVDLHQLEHKRLAQAPKQQKQVRQAVKEAPKAKMKDEDFF